MFEDFWEEELIKEIEEILKNKLPQPEDDKILKEKLSLLINRWENLLLEFERVLERVKRIEKLIETKEDRKKEKVFRRIRGQKENITPQEAYEIPILEILCELGGSASISEVHKRIEEKMKDIFTEKDKEFLACGSPRWLKNVDWCRYKMVQKGLLRNDSPRGIWELSEDGYRFTENLKNGQ